MELRYKPDWERTKERYRAWWAHEYFGRCALAVTAPRSAAGDGPVPAARSVEQRWYDLDWISAAMDHHLERTYFGGEALPVWNGGYPGHTSLPVYMGCRCELDWDTGWVYPVLTAAAIDCAGLQVDRHSRDYRFAMALLERGVREAAGRCLVSVGAFGGCGDTLASLRGTEQLLYDCLDRPAEVRAAERFCMDAFITYYETVFQATRQANEGSVCWFGTWAPGRHYCAHCDFSYMISPAMFRRLFLDSIERQTRYLEYSVYHVDGIAAFAHVPALCELPRLQAIQILPGAGKPSPLHYLDALRQVQAAGRNLHITIPADEVRPALELLSARGLFIQTWCESEEQARALLRDAARWSADRR